MRRSRCLILQADQKISEYGEALKQQYGFLADPRLPLWKNVENFIGEMELTDYTSRPRNMACHNLLRTNKLPAGTNSLLGLGLNFCIESATATKTTEKTFDRLTKDIRRHYAFSKSPPEEQDYIPSLYIKSDYEFPPASPNIEKALLALQQAIQAKQLRHQQRQKQRRNITVGKWTLMQWLRKNDNYIVVQGDKNLGPCIIDREVYISRGINEHLGNKRNYARKSAREASNHLIGMRLRLGRWLSDFEDDISTAEYHFLYTSLKKYPDKHARFRMTAKVHKTPWKTRPIVCCAGTFMNDWSKWLDFWLQKLKTKVPTYVKDSQQVVDETKALKLPPNSLLFAADANSMYNNIDTKHAIKVIDWWLNDLAKKKELPEGFPLEAVLSAMRDIMRENLFGWGDMFFKQLIGTAMGTSAAVMWATLYFAYHEVHTLIPKHGHNLLYFRRFIDDIHGVWTGNTTTDWKAFQDDVNTFGILTWDIVDVTPSTSVNFLDLTLTIEGDRIVTKTFQKKMNLYLYIPFASAHPTGCIKGTIYGLIRRYHAQNTYRHDYIHFVILLYRRLLERGWDRAYIRGLISEATATIESDNTKKRPPPARDGEEDDDIPRLFLHLQYHPHDIPRQEIQQEYQRHCAKLFKKELGIDRPTIAYSRPKNVGDYVTQAKLHQAPGRLASTIMGELEQGLSP